MSYEVTEQERFISRIGCKIMDLAVTETDDALSNRMSVLGCTLSELGTTFGKKFNQITEEEKSFLMEIVKKYPEITK